MNIKDILFYVSIAVVVIENILPHIKSVKANSTVQLIKGGLVGLLKGFSKNK